MRMTVIVIVGALAALALTAWLVGAQWASLGADISVHGWIAYAAGGLLSLAVSGALFYVLFYSARHGHDDAEHNDDTRF